MEDKRVFYTKSEVELMGVKNLLDSEGIDYFEIDKSDTSYAGLFGYYELKVNEKEAEKAENLIKDFQAE